MRKVEDVSTRGGGPELEVHARPIETYVRPAEEPEGSVEAIAKSLIAINPEISKYIAQKKEEKKNYEEAVGAQIWLNMSEEGKNYTAAEIRQKIEKGELEGVGALTTHMHNGVVKMRHKALGNSINMHMQEWTPTATVKDAEGNEIPVTEVDDQTVAEAAFNAELSRYTKEVTGGKYDPVLFQEYAAGGANEAHHSFIQKQSAARVAKINRDQEQALVTSLDALQYPLIKNNAFVLDTAGAVTGLTNAYLTEMEDAKQEGMQPEAVRATVYKQIMISMNGAEVKGIEGLLSVAKQLPEIWNDPEMRMQLEDQAGKAVKERRAKNRAEYEDKVFEQQMFVETWIEEHVEKYEDIFNIPPKEIEELRKKYPLQAGLINTVLVNNDNASDATASLGQKMPTMDFNELRMQFYEGGGSWEKIKSLSRSMSPEQHNELWQIWTAQVSQRNSAESHARAMAGSSAPKKSKWTPEKLCTILEKTMYGNELNSATPDKQVAMAKLIRNMAPDVLEDVRRVESAYPNDEIKQYNEIMNVIEKASTKEKALNNDFVADNPEAGKGTQVDVTKKRIARDINNATKSCIPGRRRDIDALNSRLSEKGYVPTNLDISLVQTSFGGLYKQDPERYFRYMAPLLQEYGNLN